MSPSLYQPALCVHFMLMVSYKDETVHNEHVTSQSMCLHHISLRESLNSVSTSFSFLLKRQKFLSIGEALNIAHQRPVAYSKGLLIVK